jgi:mono/diheme cytochrome c family protein
MRTATALAFVLLLAACKRQDMYTQDSSKTWDQNNFFPRQTVMQSPPPGTVARNAPDQTMPQPARITQAMLVRGQQRFDIFCTPCHGRLADGEGMIVQRGFPSPPSLLSDTFIHAKASRFFDAMTKGYGAMYSFADQVDAADRWAIIAYIRALQRSQATPSATLSPADRTQLAVQR